MRPAIRNLTHTFDFSKPSFNVRISEVVKSQWLRDLLDLLPSLQSLVLSNGSLIGHQQLLAINTPSLPSSSDPVVYPLRLLDLSSNNNLTSQSVTSVLQNFPELIYLDLSTWTGARGADVLRQIGSLSQLRVLRLSRCGIRNSDVRSIVIPTSLLSLDVSFCWLTHVGLSILLEKFPKDSYRAPSSRRLPRISAKDDHGRIFSGNLHRFVAREMKSQQTIDITLDLPDHFCELNVEGNEITVGDIINTFSNTTLDHMECGTLSMAQSQSVTVAGASELHYHPRVGIQHLNARIFTKAFQYLRSLRIHHSMVTDYIFGPGKDFKQDGTLADFMMTEDIERLTGSDFVESASAIQSLANVRKSFTKLRVSRLERRAIARFQPLLLPNLKILALTDVPTRTTMDSTIQSILVLIQELAEEENFARIEHLGWSQPPEEAPHWTLLSRSPLKLRTLILETALDEARANARHNQDSYQAAMSKKLTRSTVEDADADGFVEASEKDFSFFRTEESERETPDSVSWYTKRAVSSAAPARGGAQNSNGKWIEIVPTIVKFRRESRSRHDSNNNLGGLDIERLFSGHWIGEIKVIRKQTD